LKNTKILVTGANGQLGSEIKALSDGIGGFAVTFIDVEDLDLTDRDAVEAFFKAGSYDYVINCAAYTAVDKAESDEDTAFKVNAAAVGLLGEVTAHYKTRIIHISTDYVFDGSANRPYTEDDEVNPVSAYGRSKLKGEELLQKNNPDSVIIRTAWLYSAFGNNFVKTMLRLGKERDELRVVFDQVGSPTHAADLAKAVVDIIQKTESGDKEFVTGIYHFSNEGVISWYDFAYHILDLAGVECKIIPVLSEEYPVPAPRPAYSVLNKEKIKDIYDIDVPYWYDSLKRMLDGLR
jgi:dTDP-4-dehydrorhamnose reductase